MQKSIIIINISNEHIETESLKTPLIMASHMQNIKNRYNKKYVISLHCKLFSFFFF